MTAQTLRFFLVGRGLAKLLENLRVDRLAVGASGGFGHDGFHHRTHLRFAGGADFGDGFAHQGGKFFDGKSGRQIRLQDGDFGILFFRLLGASAFAETFGRILALLDAFADDRHNIRVGQVRFGSDAFFDHLIFDRGLEHAEGAEPVRGFGFHRFFDVLVDFRAETHGVRLNRSGDERPDVSRPAIAGRRLLHYVALHMSAPRKIPVLGTPVAVVDYGTAIEESRRLAGEPRPSAVAASNTHIISLARQRADFGQVMRKFDLVLPDGMPLRWSLNAQGAQLKDRVYGPYFMEKMIRATPRPWRHFFFGGTEETLAELTEHLRVIQPDIEIAGTLSPPFRAWTEADEKEFARTIAGANADFIWVALGGERQERWIIDNLHRHTRGVFFAVGDAFALLAGQRDFAPAWMQRLGITWLYRLWQEPRRLWRRYTRFNSLFVFYTLRDSLLGAPREEPAEGRLPSIAFLGSRGVPARYSGFEVVVEELGKRLAARGHDVTVYNRLPHFGPPHPVWEGMRIIGLPTIPTKSLDTIVHTTLSMLDALRRRYDIIYLCGVGNAILGRLARAAGMGVIINVDGADFNRKKWSGFARLWLQRSEEWATKSADVIIADNTTIADRYERQYGVRPEHLSYGLTVRDEPVKCGELERWGVKPGGYFLYVSRLTPENEAELLLRAYRQVADPLPLVLVGADPYEKSYRRKLESLSADRVIFAGLRFSDAYVELSQNARAFIMPATIEATRLVLLDQLGMGSAIIYHDCPATREVLGDAGIPFGPADPVNSLAEKLAWAKDHPEECAAAGQRARQRAEIFRWETVLDRYQEIFRKIQTPAGR